MIEKIISRTPNAFKHGAFARTLFIFKGDQEKFAEIHESLRQEYQPEGFSEEDCIRTTATLYFRKERLPLMLHLQRQKSRNQPTDRILDELLNTDPAVDPDTLGVGPDVTGWGIDENASPHLRPELDPLLKRVSNLLGLSRALFTESSARWLLLSMGCLVPQDSDYISDNIAPGDFRNNAEYMAAIKKIIDDELLPAARREYREKAGQTPDDAVRTFDGMSSEEIAAELALMEKIEQQIARQLTQLGRIRALKCIAPDRSGRRLNRLPAPVIENSTGTATPAPQA